MTIFGRQQLGVTATEENSLIPNRSPHPAIAETSESIRNFLTSSDISAFTTGPGAGSPFESEKQRLPPSKHVGTETILTHAQMTCQFRLLAAMDFVSGIASLMGTAASVYSVFPLSRAAIESAAYVTWILDPVISAEQRACRGALDHRESTRESLKNLQRYAQSGLTEHQSRKAAAGIAQLELHLAVIEEDLTLAKEALPVDLREQYPSKRQVVADAVAAFAAQAGVGSGYYGYLSDVAHGGITGLRNLHQSAEMMANFNLTVESFLLPVAIAITTMQPCLARIATSWGSLSANDEMQQVLEVLTSSYRYHSSEPAFQ